MRISYDNEYKDSIIAQAGLKVGKNGYLLDAKTNKLIRDINGELVKYNQFSGFRKGSVDFIKSDLSSLIKLSKKLK